jgi:hypothetical protein
MSYFSDVMAEGPIALYKLDEPAGSTVFVDSSGNGRDGAIDAGVTLDQASFMPSQSEGCWQMNAAEGGLVTGASWMVPASGEITYLAPCYITLYDSDTTVLAARANIAGSNAASIKAWSITVTGTGGVQGRIYSGTGATVVLSSAAGVVPLNTPCLVAFRQNATSVQFLVNGVVVATSALAGGLVSFATNTAPLSIARSQTTSVYGFNGKTAMHAMFDKILSDATILDLYNAMMDGTAPTPPPPGPGSWSWWTRPRVVAYDGKVYVGSITQDNKVVVDEYDASDGSHTTRHVVKSGIAFDDHNNPALIIEPGEPPIVIWHRHNITNTLHYAKGTQDIELGFTSGAESTIAAGGSCTYAAVHIIAGVIYVIFRTNGTSWRYVSSSNWGTSWTAAKKFATFTQQGYVASRLVGSRIRLAASYHPREVATLQEIFYAELDPVTGNIYNRAGSVLGIAGSTDPAVEAWDEAAVPTVFGYKTWIYDISEGPDREIVWGQMETSDNPTITDYYYTTDASGSWATEHLADAGVPFGDEAASNNGGNYLGGCQFIGPYEVLVAREDSGTWYVDRNTTADDGATWTVENLLTDAVNRLARAWPAETRDATSDEFIAVNVVVPPFSSYLTHDSEIELFMLGSPPLASGVSWWDGDSLEAAELVGWWDGAAIQPAVPLGWWDGADIQPLV